MASNDILSAYPTSAICAEFNDTSGAWFPSSDLSRGPHGDIAATNPSTEIAPLARPVEHRKVPEQPQGVLDALSVRLQTRDECGAISWSTVSSLKNRLIVGGVAVAIGVGGTFVAGLLDIMPKVGGRGELLNRRNPSQSR